MSKKHDNPGKSFTGNQKATDAAANERAKSGHGQEKPGSKTAEREQQKPQEAGTSHKKTGSGK